MWSDRIIFNKITNNQPTRRVLRPQALAGDLHMASSDIQQVISDLNKALELMEADWAATYAKEAVYKARISKLEARVAYLEASAREKEGGSSSLGSRKRNPESSPLTRSKGRRAAKK